MSETQILTDPQRLAARTNALLHPLLDGEGGEISGTFDDASLLGEFAAFLHEERAYWLAPLIGSVCFLSAAIAFAEGSALAPFIYALW